VIAVTAISNSLAETLNTIYKTIDSIHFDGMHYRKDIGHRLAREFLSLIMSGGKEEGRSWELEMPHIHHFSLFVTRFKHGDMTGFLLMSLGHIRCVSYIYRALKLIESKKTRCASTTYADAGVDVHRGDRFVDMVRPLAKSTTRLGADVDLMGFAGLFDLRPLNYKDPILVCCTDGVGTKLKIAQLVGEHGSVGKWIDIIGIIVFFHGCTCLMIIVVISNNDMNRKLTS
jgi:hypothetical protein